MPKRSLGGSHYIITFIDDSTQKVLAYSLRAKDEALAVFSRWLAEVENRTRHRVKTLWSDNGGKYTSRAFKLYLSEKGIRHQKTIPYTPMQNGVAKWIDRTIQERVMALLQPSGLNLEFWAEALQATVYVINMSSSKAIRLEVPQALWSGKEPSYDRLRIFGCEAYAFIPREKRTKLAPHATKCIFIGYGTDGEFGYRLWELENRKLIQSSDVVFNKGSIISRN